MTAPFKNGRASVTGCSNSIALSAGQCEKTDANGEIAGRTDSAANRRNEGTSMQVKLAGKYDLKDLYEQISLFDRKIAYCRDHEQFESEEARASALQKLVTKRGTLVASAEAVVGRGVECDAKYLPRSLRKPESTEQVTS